MKLIAKNGCFEGQFRCGNAGRPRVVIMTRDEAIAQERAIRMQGAVSLLVQSNQHAEALVILRKMAEARNQRDFSSIEAAARHQAATSPEPPPAVGPVTFRHVAEMWLSGALYEQHRGVPGLNAKETVSVANARGLMNVIYPIIGDLPVRSITRDDCDKVKRSVSQRKKKNGDAIKTSRVIRYCRVVRQVLGFCVEPLRLIDVVPVSEKWVPSEDDDDRAFQMIYPNEDRKLMLCTNVDLDVRLYFGLLWRCGLRPGEGARLRWRNITFTVGKIAVEKTKTGKPRAFHPEDDVMRALEAYKPADAQPDDLVFPRILANLSQVVEDFLQPALKTAGLDSDRPELVTSTKESRHLVAHDGRATYVTLKGGLGATEAEIMRVTGHETSKEIRTYTRQIGEIAELVKRGKISWFEPLDALLGLRSGEPSGASEVAHGVARVIEFPAKNAARRSPARTSEGSFETAEPPNSRGKHSSNGRTRGAVPPENGGVAQDDRARLVAAVATAAVAGDLELANWLRGELAALGEVAR